VKKIMGHALMQAYIKKKYLFCQFKINFDPKEIKKSRQALK
jgi:hypothetical protein